MRCSPLLAALALTLGACSPRTAPREGVAPPAAPVQAPHAVTGSTAPAEAPAPDAGAAAAPRGPARVEAQPVTERREVVDRYHGEEVRDPYRWLEEGAAPEVRAWTAAQGAHARRVLEALPHRAVVEAEVARVLGAEAASYADVTVAGGRWFALLRRPPRPQAVLVVADGPGGAAGARALVDPAALDPAGGTAIDWFVPSPDGALVAVSLSRGGTERGDVHLFDVASGERVDVVIPHVNGGTAGGALLWSNDRRGFWYTRYPRGEEQPEGERDFWVQVHFHVLGTPTEGDAYELGRGLPRIAEYRLEADRRTGRALCTVQDGDGGTFAHFLRAADGRWRRLTRFEDGVVSVAFGPGEDLYAMTRAGAPKGRIVRVSGATLDVAGAVEVVAEGTDALVEDFWGKPTVLVTASRIFAVYQLGGPSAVRVFDLDGRSVGGPEVPPVSANGGLEALGGDEVLFWSRSFVTPTVWSRFDAATGATTRTSFASEAPVSLEDVTVERSLARSKDGTLVPVNVLAPRGVPRDGTAPCVVTGYGGYGVNLEPSFQARYRPLFDQGVVVAIANLRGGAEFGEAWHRAGSLVHKQNVFDDFAGVLEHLVATGVAAPGRVGITGGSNGGLLMGATLVQHPERVAAVVSFVGIYDMLRVERSANGAFNVPEFGTVADEAQYRALRAYSPYHNVRDGVPYPPTLLLTGENDPRVDPLQSRKMAAQLQAAVATSPRPGAPVLLRTSADAGHGGDTPLAERVAQYADAWAFMLDQLAVPWRTPVNHRPR